MRFRKKPVVIDAMLFDGRNHVAIAEWFIEYGQQFEPSLEGFTILTLEGDMLAKPGDWIVKGIANEFYPCKPGIFADTYEKVDGE